MEVHSYHQRIKMEILCSPGFEIIFAVMKFTKLLTRLLQELKLRMLEIYRS